MNGLIVQKVFLCIYGNAALKNKMTIPELMNLSGFQFCKSVTYFEEKKWLLGKRKTIISNTPNEWIEDLSKDNTGISLSYNSLANSDRMTAGLIGGGGKWVLHSHGPGTTKAWEADWTVGYPNDQDQKIWEVKYLGEDIRSPGLDFASPKTNELLASLIEIEKFAIDQDLDGFSTCFRKSIETLESRGKILHGYHQDLVPDCYETYDAKFILDACQSAWVFGGMGSWNDMMFEGDAQMQYEKLSDNLFRNLIGAIVDASNSTLS